MPPVLMDAKQLGERLGVSPKTVLGWARREEIPCLRANHRVFFNLVSVANTLQERDGSDPGAPRLKVGGGAP